MAEVIIFGIRDLAELAHYYIENDSEHEIAAFTVNECYLPETRMFHNLPVLSFEDIEQHLPANRFSFFAPLTHKNMNRDREKIYSEIKMKGYKMINYISSRATIFGNLIIGDNCFILEDNTIQPFVEIGNNVILWSGNHIGHHSKIDNNAFITSQVVISGNCTIGPNCFIGVNSALKENITLGEASFIAMSTSVTQNTEPFSVYSGNPAKKIDMSSLRMRY
jgi:sugar O-acyltransferase (sialic acid O-acetyltransferase NeuD family)